MGLPWEWLWIHRMCPASHSYFLRNDDMNTGQVSALQHFFVGDVIDIADL